MKERKEPITPYHWIVVIIASLGWLFDCMDQRIFALSCVYILGIIASIWAPETKEKELPQ